LSGEVSMIAHQADTPQRHTHEVTSLSRAVIGERME